MTGSTRWCPMATTPITRRGRRSASVPTSCASSTIISASRTRCRAWNVSTRTATSIAHALGDQPSPPFRLHGLLADRGAEPRRALLPAGWSTRDPEGTTIMSSILTPSSRHALARPCAAGVDDPARFCVPALPTRPRRSLWRRVRGAASAGVHVRRVAQRAPGEQLVRDAWVIAPPSTMAWCGSG